MYELRRCVMKHQKNKKPNMLSRAIKKSLGQLTIFRDIVAMSYCHRDPQTPFWVKSILYIMAFYFIFPVDFIPDFLFILGYSDDVAAVVILYQILKSNLTEEHIRKAHAWIDSHQSSYNKNVIDLDDEEWREIQ
jgi:uncharacterized membrane protein YkvA (DUF1232 family)